MEDNMWGFTSSGSSRSHRLATAAKYQSGSFIELGKFEEEEDDDVGVEYQCPFCSDDYDLIELCRHIDDEHHHEANHGICPVCSIRVKMHIVDHITTHHIDVLKKLYNDQKQISYKEDPYSSDNYLLDELSLSINNHHTSTSVASDQFLSFINNSPLPNQTKLVQPSSSVEDKASLVEKDGKSVSPLSDTEKLEKANKSKFVQGILLSAMFDDGCDFF